MTSTYKAKLLFIICDETKEQIDCSRFSEFKVAFKLSIGPELNLKEFAFICIDESVSDKEVLGIEQSNCVWANIGTEKRKGSYGLLKTPIVTSDLYQLIQGLIGKSNHPKLNRIDIGSVVRSKSTPGFGKGVIIRMDSEYVALVSFPLSKLCSKKPIKCHISNLQRLGQLDRNSKIFYSYI